MADATEKKSRVPPCHNCGAKPTRDDKHDAYYCPSCLIWLEGICTDMKCPNCTGRPSMPRKAEEPR